jgi:hypothetical protein
MFSANIRKQSALILVKTIRARKLLLRACFAMWSAGSQPTQESAS